MEQRYVRAIVVFIVALCLPLTIIAKSDPKPQCVGCGVQDDCKACVGGDSSYCRTFNCGACAESGTCDLLLSVSSLAPRNRRPLKLPNELIREISLKHPRFAITLAEMNVYGISPGEHRIFWTPVALASPDVEAFLNKGDHSRFFKRYDNEARRLNRLVKTGELSDIVYAVSVNRTDEDAWLIKMQVRGQTITSLSGDSAYSLLEIQVGPQATTSAQKQSRKTITWQIQ